MKPPLPIKTFLLLWLSHFIVDFYIGIWPIYKTAAQIDLAKAGLIMGVAGFTGEMLQVIFGYFSDRGLRKAIFLFGLLMTAAIVLTTLTSNLYLLFGVMMCVMIGSGAFHPAAVGMTSNLIPSNRTSILIFTSGGALGLAFSQVAFSKSFELFHQQLWPLAIPSLLLIPFLLRHRFSTQDRTRPTMKEIFLPFLRHRRALTLLYLAQVIAYGVLLCFIFLLPDILQSKGASPWLCKGGGHMCFILGAFIGMVLLSLFSSRTEIKSTLFFANLSALALFFLFLLTPLVSTGWTIALLAPMGASLFLMSPLIITWGNQLIPESPSTVSALMMGLAWSFSNLFPTAAGLLARSFTTDPATMAMMAIALVLFISLLLVVLTPAQEKEATLQLSE
jgi:FSR family fosmidomycin resistance protein-like MFS transporter